MNKTAKEVLQDFLTETNSSRINEKNIGQLSEWLETKYRKHLPGALFVARGLGGGQTYKTLWSVFDCTGNNGRLCVFYNENPSAIKILEHHGHMSLDTWLATPMAQLEF